MMLLGQAAARVHSWTSQVPSFSFGAPTFPAGGERALLMSCVARAPRKATREPEEKSRIRRSCGKQTWICFGGRSHGEGDTDSETLYLCRRAWGCPKQCGTAVSHFSTWRCPQHRSVTPCMLPWPFLTSVFPGYTPLCSSGSRSRFSSLLGTKHLLFLRADLRGLLHASPRSTRCLSSASFPQPAACTEVLIVGAGLTGLTAAHAFLSRVTPEEALHFRRRLDKEQVRQAQGLPLACSTPSPGANVVSDSDFSPPRYLSSPGANNSTCSSPESSSSPATRSSHSLSLCTGPPLPPLLVIAESSSRPGGCLRTRKSPCERFLFDVGANSFRLTSGTIDLLRDLNLLAQVQTADPQLERFVGFDGELVPLPFSSLSALFSSKLLSRQGKLRLLAGLCGVFPPRFLWNLTRTRDDALATRPPPISGPRIVHEQVTNTKEQITGRATLTSGRHPFGSEGEKDKSAAATLPETGREDGMLSGAGAHAKKGPLLSGPGKSEAQAMNQKESVFGRKGHEVNYAVEESVRDFVERRLGVEMHDRVVDALVTGICAGDSAKLSMRAALPAAYEALKHGVLVFGIRRGASRVLSYLRTLLLTNMVSRRGRVQYKNPDITARCTQAGGFCTEEKKLKSEGHKTRIMGVDTEKSGIGRGRASSMRSGPSVGGSQLQGIVNFDSGMQTLTDALVARLSPAATCGKSVPCFSSSHSPSLATGEGECALCLGWELKELRTVHQPCLPVSPVCSSAVPLFTARPPRAGAVVSHSSSCHFGSRPSLSTPFKFEAVFNTPEGSRRLLAKHVLLTVPAKAAGRVLGHLLSTDLTEKIQDMKCASMALVTLAYSKAAFRELRTREQRRSAEREENQAAVGQLPRGQMNMAAPQLSGSWQASRRGAARRMPHKSSLYTFAESPDPGVRSEQCPPCVKEEPEETANVAHGFGFLLPSKEREREKWGTLGGIFVSNVFNGRVPVFLEKNFLNENDCTTNSPNKTSRDPPEEQLPKDQDRLFPRGSELVQGKQSALNAVHKAEEERIAVGPEESPASGRTKTNDDGQAGGACRGRDEAGDVGLVTIFIGGIRDGTELLEKADSELGVLAKADLVRAVLGTGTSKEDEEERQALMKEAIKVLNVERWKDTIPQYCKGHEAVLRELEKEMKLITTEGTTLKHAAGMKIQDAVRKSPGGLLFGGENEVTGAGGGELLIEGNWISGPAVGDRIDAGRKAGERLAQAVRRG
ncbi:protoporphyrinogen oxidase [Cystoisospora suis]|uniref:Protoporphyrinogen oxidase n=1 Tax=Cystoisospora suis TaxID=483139 RepID=A0A2C6KUL8_9APIC|nr:protoporphyrinogen oxidase [Cystoisospora suis]